MKIKISKHSKLQIAVFILILLLAVSGFGQKQSALTELKPNQTIEREMTGKVTHRYKFNLKAGEFFQVRVEQKGVDVSLKLLDKKKKQLVTMNSPNGLEGFETLSFIPDKSGKFILEIINSNEKIKSAKYILKRQPSHTANEKNKRRVEVERDFTVGMQAFNSDRKNSLDKLKNALNGWQQIRDSEMEKMTLWFVDFQILVISSNNANALLKEAQEEFKVGINKGKLEIINSSKEKGNTADTKFNETEQLVIQLIKNHPEFISKNPALKNHLFFAKTGQINVANFISNVYQHLIKPKEQLKYAEKALLMSKELNSIDTVGLEANIKLIEASNLASLASALSENKNLKVLEVYEEFLEKYPKLKKFGKFYYKPELEAIYNAATSYAFYNLCRDKKAYCLKKTIEYSNKTISKYKEIKDNKNLAEFYLFVSAVYLTADNFYEALNSIEQSKFYANKANDKSNLSKAVLAEGVFYTRLGNRKKGIELLKEGSEILLSIPSYTKNISSYSPFERRTRLRQEYGRLLNITSYYDLIGEHKKSLKYEEKVLEVSKKLKNKSDEAFILGTIGRSFSDLKNWQKAQEYFQQSLKIYQEVGNKEKEAYQLVSLGMAYIELNKPQEASQNLTESEIIYSSLGKEDAGNTNTLARTWYALGNRRMAIFYGKKLVNWVQGEKTKLNDFDLATQQTFINSFEKPIRRLADWLIEDGQFAQAEKVLRILKEQEYAGFVRRDANEIKSLGERVDLNDEEKNAISKYEKLTDEISKIGQEFYRLEQKQIKLNEKSLELNKEDQKLLEEKGNQLAMARLAFEAFLTKELVKEIGEAKKRDIDTQRSKQEDLRNLPKGTVLLYTVLGEDRYRVILTTPDIQIDGKYEIKAAELNKKIFSFRDALKNPNVDPRPLGKEIYDIIIKPIEKDLKNSEAKTLLWYLDGTLRYIPIAALSPDGKSYLVEKYQNVVLTAKSNNLDSQGAGANWRVLGLGVSDAQTVDNPFIPKDKISFSALPGTENELVSIISDENLQNERGILPGKRFLNQNFTLNTFENSLRGRKFNVVHLASHFYLGSKDANSFLLLGNGEILPLSQFESRSFIRFGGVDLVTLSACNTAFADNSNGSEVDSLADVIQSRGGKSVLATLWAVADESTSLLMSEFYRIKKANPNLTKAEAIKMAQLAMISGKLKSTNAGNKKGVETFNKDGKNSNLPKFKTDEKAPFAHPYYWSPFVLIGNWK